MLRQIVMDLPQRRDIICIETSYYARQTSVTIFIKEISLLCTQQLRRDNSIRFIYFFLLRFLFLVLVPFSKLNYWRHKTLRIIADAILSFVVAWLVVYCCCYLLFKRKSASQSVHNFKTNIKPHGAKESLALIGGNETLHNQL